MPIMRTAPAPFVAPQSGDIDQRLSSIVAMINALQSRVQSPTFEHITLQDTIGQTWAVYCQSNGQLRTELVTRPPIPNPLGGRS